MRREIIVANTFTQSLTKLDKTSSALVKQAAFEFQLNPKHPGFKFHRVDRAKDKRFWTFRVSRDIRIVVHLTHSTFILCFAAHHDDAYHWAERRRLNEHPVTGALQLVEVIESTEEIVKRVVREVEEAPEVPPPFSKFEVDDLLALGVPVEWMAWLQAALT